MSVAPVRIAQQTPVVTDSAAAVAVSLAAALMAETLNEVNVFLAWLMVGAFGLDIISGLTRSLVLEGLDGYRGEKLFRGLGKKVGLGLIAAGALVVDLMFGAMGIDSFADYTPMVKVALCTIIVTQAISVIRNGGEAAGQPRISEFVIRAIRGASELRPGLKVGEAGKTHVVVINENAAEEDPDA